MYHRLRPILFRLPPEEAHHLTLALLHLAGRLPPIGRLLIALLGAPKKPVSLLGLEFANPVGLAAGYDKDGLAWRGLACLGFGHIEVGTVTLQPQAGNPPPRLFRLPSEQALINRMGFPSQGAQAVLPRLGGKRPGGMILGANLGKNKDTPLEGAAREYQELTRLFAPSADYLAINVSSPNTPGLRGLQRRQELERLLSQVAEERRRQELILEKRIPVLVKLAPDLTDQELDDALEAVAFTGIDGVIASNTTLNRDGINHPGRNEAGGLSGAPLRTASTKMVHHIHQRTAGKLPIIAAGGIMSADDALQKLEAGARLVQIYTGLVYNGPGLVKQIVANLP